ncbi:MAG: cyclic lactone autoinducer peptide [Eubacteriales bacterium]
MRKILIKHASLVSALALIMVTYSANTTCAFWCHQPETPKNIKDFRKF